MVVGRVDINKAVNGLFVLAIIRTHNNSYTRLKKIVYNI
jgi:hypothetical protein